jgi:hypothetical protein
MECLPVQSSLVLKTLRNVEKLVWASFTRAVSNRAFNTDRVPNWE